MGRSRGPRPVGSLDLTPARARPARLLRLLQRRRLAIAHDLVLVLKGHRTLITDGRQSAHNTTGNPGMATGGSGDVLTGVICALICQGLSPFDAARLGVYIHGSAGDLAATQLGEVGMVASDLLDFLPSAFQKSGTFC